MHSWRCWRRIRRHATTFKGGDDDDDRGSCADVCVHTLYAHSLLSWRRIRRHARMLECSRVRSLVRGAALYVHLCVCTLMRYTHRWMCWEANLDARVVLGVCSVLMCTTSLVCMCKCVCCTFTSCVCINVKTIYACLHSEKMYILVPRTADTNANTHRYTRLHTQTSHTHNPTQTARTPRIHTAHTLLHIIVVVLCSFESRGACRLL